LRLEAHAGTLTRRLVETHRIPASPAEDLHSVPGFGAGPEIDADQGTDAGKLYLFFPGRTDLRQMLSVAWCP
jgi:hypothetical protein